MGLSGVVTASFQYDGVGRRIGKTVAGTATAFLYDGLNPVQELAGNTPTANLITGGLDEVFSRTDSAGTRHLLTDALGSTLALTDSNGVATTSYSYEPYGKASTNGAANDNSYQYTGRENDNTGLNFNRARYYNPSLHRFISEDPIGLAGGVNMYAYVRGNPVNAVDPTGLYTSDVHSAITFNAARQCGMGIMDSLALAWDAVATDWRTQGVSDAFIHSMIPAGVSPAIAELETNNYIDEQMSLGTIRGLGNAVHTVQDATAAGHGGKVYDGHVSFSHFYHDAFPTEPEYDQAFKNSRELISKYMQSKGMSCTCPQ